MQNESKKLFFLQFEAEQMWEYMLRKFSREGVRCEVHFFFVKKTSSSSFLNLRKNNITILSEIMWKRFIFS